MASGHIIKTHDVIIYLNGKKLLRVDSSKLIIDSKTQVVQVEMKFTPTKVEWGQLEGHPPGEYQMRIELT